MKKKLVEPTNNVCPPPHPTEAVILTLARTRQTFTRNHINEAMTEAGIASCYEQWIEKVEQQGDITPELGGGWRSEIFRGLK